MTRAWSTVLVLVVACLVAVGMASAQEKKEKKGRERPSPEKRFDAMEKAVNHDPLTGELTKEEFVKAMKELTPRMADQAEKIFKSIKKADENKVTKEEYVASWKDRMSKRGKRGEKKPEN